MRTRRDSLAAGIAVLLSLLIMSVATALPDGGGDIGGGVDLPGDGTGGGGNGGDTGNPGTPGGPGGPTPGGNGGGLPDNYTVESGHWWAPGGPPGRIGRNLLPIGGIGYLHWNGGAGWSSDLSGAGCAGSTQWGNFIGGEWWFAYSTLVEDASVAGDDNSTAPHMIVHETTRAGAYTCYDPPHYNDASVQCPHSGKAILRGNNPFSWRVIASPPRELSPFAAGGMNDPALCNQDYSFSFNKQISDYGRYQLDVTGRSVSCTIRTYTTPNKRTGSIPPPEVVRCGAPHVTVSVSPRLQVFCPDPGYSRNWSGNWLFTTEDCENAPVSQAIWGCFPQGGDRAGGDPLFANRHSATNRFEVLDDGRPRPLRWDAPNPWGVASIFNDTKRTRLQYMSGQPFREGSPVTSPDQPFVTAPPAGTWVDGWRIAGGRSQYAAAFQSAGGADDSPWVARPQWYFEGMFPVTQVTITGIDMPSGTPVVETSTVLKRLAATCTGKPVSIDVYRARSSSGQ